MGFYTLKHSDFTLLTEITQLPSVSGNEYPLDNELLAFRKFNPLDVRQDRIGNIVVKLDSEHWDPSKPTILVSAHKDKIGFMVQELMENGTVRLAPIGGIIYAKSQQSLLLYRGSDVRLPGTLEVEIDVTRIGRSLVSYYGKFGFSNRAELEKQVMVGDPVSIKGDFHGRPDEPDIVSPYLDDSIGVFIGLKLAAFFAVIESQPKKIPAGINLAIAFSTQEEVGLRGIRSVLRDLTPSLLIVTDVVNVTKTLRKGYGPALVMLDPGIVLPTELRQKLVSLAEATNVPLQIEVYSEGGTSDWEISVTEGFLTIPLGLPLEHIHTPYECVSRKDLEYLLNFVGLLVKRAEDLIIERPG
jgi:putative aminopeptidase FrvX